MAKDNKIEEVVFKKRHIYMVPSDPKVNIDKFICSGGLPLCIKCRALGDELTTDCCDFDLPQVILDEVYNNGLDYKDGYWYYKR